MIQEKIIQDQADTIKKLKQNITLHKGSAETACADVNNLLKQLQNERDAKEELLNEIKVILGSWGSFMILNL